MVAFFPLDKRYLGGAMTLKFPSFDLVGGFSPFEKIWVKLEIFPQIEMKI